MKKVLIIGGAGFLGYHLTKKLLLKKKYKITLLDNFSRGKKDKYFRELMTNKNINLINQDLTKKINFPEDDYLYIYQFAAIIGVQNVLKQPLKVLTNNFLIQNNSIKIALKQLNLKRFIFASTSEVYLGNQKYKKLKYPTPENHKIMLYDLKNSRTSYSLSKLYGEAMIALSDINYTIIRPHNIYGERMGFSHVIPELILRIKKTKKNGNLYLDSPQHKRCFCYVDDAINQIYKLSKNKKALNDVFNIGNKDEEIKIIDLIKLISKIMNRKDIKINYSKREVASPSRRVPDLNKTFNTIKINNQTSLLKGCSKVIKWYLEI